MDIGTLIQDVIHALSVAGWILFVSGPAIWLYRKRHSLPWTHHPLPYNNTLCDAFLGVATLAGLALLHATNSI